MGSGSVLHAPFQAFKFPASDIVQFRALVTPCLPRCEPVQCSVQGFDGVSRKELSYGRKKREVGSYPQLHSFLFVHYIGLFNIFPTLSVARCQKLANIFQSWYWKKWIFIDILTIRQTTSLTHHFLSVTCPHYQLLLFCFYFFWILSFSLWSHYHVSLQVHETDIMVVQSVRIKDKFQFSGTRQEEVEVDLAQETCSSFTGVVVACALFLAAQVVLLMAWSYLWHKKRATKQIDPNPPPSLYFGTTSSRTSSTSYLTD